MIECDLDCPFFKHDALGKCNACDSIGKAYEEKRDEFGVRVCALSEAEQRAMVRIVKQYFRIEEEA